MSYDIITCERLVELATEYFEGGLEVPERLRFERHLTICPPCRGFVGQFRATVAAAGAMPAEPLSPDTRDALLDAFRVWKVGR